MGSSKVQEQGKKVLIFDSGVGGLSVYQEIRGLLPQLQLVYLFDNKAYPYGELPEAILISRVLNLVGQAVEKQRIDLVVIACNTASTTVLPHLRAKLSIPVVGVVPAIKPASIIAKKAVCLIATPATIKREYTHQLIKEFALRTEVKLIGSTRLVDIAEDKLRGISPNIDELANIFSSVKGMIDVAVLGCTHFPLLKQEIDKALEHKVHLIDSGNAIANRVKELLMIEREEGGYERKNQIFCSASPWKEDALNSQLIGLGFDSIQQLPNLDA